MSDVLTYTLSLQDKVTSKLQKIGVSSDNALNKFADLERKTKKVSLLMTDMGGSVGALRERLNLLRQERDWIPQKSINDIRKYNTEIKKLEKQIHKFETINGSKFKRSLKQAVHALPFSELITNPVAVAGAALFKSGQMAMNFDEGMAKINITAQLTDDKLKSLKSSLIKMGKEAGSDLSTVPDAFEKILSQTGDVALSQDILKASLKGSVAGFTDTEVVSGALAQSLSLIGKENANAQEVLDTFFAAKRVGAGEFKDFAQYMPNLISSGKALGVVYKQTAGLFSYMTGKGFSAERSAVLMENAYSALGKMDIQKALAKEQINIFDKDGTIRDMGAIFSELSQKMGGMSDQQKSSFLEKIGLRDKEARNAFIVLTSDAKKLNKTLKEVANSEGETQKAWEKSQNAMQKIRRIWSNVQNLMISFGGMVSSILIPALDLLMLVITPVIDALSWMFDKIAEGNPIMITLIGIVGTLTTLYYAKSIALKITALWAKRVAVTQGLLALKTGIVTVATTAWTNAQWLLNAAMSANPIGLIIAAIVALVAIISYLIYKIDGWGKMWKHTVQGSKLLWESFTLSAKAGWETLTNGIMIGLNKIQEGWYKFKEAVGMGDSAENQRMIEKIQADTEERKKAIVSANAKAITTSIQAASEFAQASQALTWNSDKSISDVKDSLMEKLGVPTSGIAPPKDANGNPIPNSGNNNNELEKTNTAIATGGTKNTTVNLQLNKELIGNVTITGKDFKESVKQMEEQLSDGLLRVLSLAVTNG